MADKKEDEYCSHVRDEIAQVAIAHVDRVLPVACEHAGNLAWNRGGKDTQFACGVALFEESAAAHKPDCVVTGNFEAIELPIEVKDFDVVPCLDVLEHFVDPWKAIHRLDSLLRPSGVLIASIPNVRYFRVVLALLFQGRWDYQDSGILDRTHLRFFTKRTALELLQASGMRMESISATGLEKGRKTRYLHMLTLGLLRPLFEYQYLVKVRKAA